MGIATPPEADEPDAELKRTPGAIHAHFPPLASSVAPPTFWAFPFTGQLDERVPARLGIFVKQSSHEREPNTRRQNIDADLGERQAMGSQRAA